MAAQEGTDGGKLSLGLFLNMLITLTFTGIFTAPVKGTYFFRFTVASDQGKYSRGSILYKNSEQVLSIFQHDKISSLQHFSSGANLELEEGDTVSLRLQSNYQLFDDEHNHNTFSGFLLFPMWTPHQDEQ